MKQTYFRSLCGIIIGVLLVLYCEDTLQYILSIAIVLGAIQQFCTLAVARNKDSVGIGYWIVPAILLICGMVAVMKPEIIKDDKWIFIGICWLLYGVAELVNSIKVSACERTFAQQQEEKIAASLASQQQQDTPQSEPCSTEDEPTPEAES